MWGLKKRLPSRVGRLHLVKEIVRGISVDCGDWEEGWIRKKGSREEGPLGEYQTAVFRFRGEKY